MKIKKYQIVESGWEHGWTYTTTIENFEAENITEDEAKRIIKEYLLENYQDYERTEGTDIQFCVVHDDKKIGGYWISDIIG